MNEMTDPSSELNPGHIKHLSVSNSNGNLIRVKQRKTDSIAIGMFLIGCAQVGQMYLSIAIFY